MRRLSWLVASFVFVTSISAQSDQNRVDSKSSVILDKEGRLTLSAGPGRPAYVINAATFAGAPVKKSLLDGAGERTTSLLGKGITTSFDSSNQHRVELTHFEGVPFTILNSTFHNDSTKPAIITSIDVATIPLDLGTPIEQLRILGTGGLTDADKASGSYMWLTVVDPKTRKGVVAGWVTTARGSGVIMPKLTDGKLTLTARLEYGHVEVAAGSDTALETLVIGYFDDGRMGLEAYAEVVAKLNNVHLPPQPSGYCTWYHAGSSSEKRLAALTDFAAKNLKPFGFSVVQIDDGWQAGEPKNGPRKNFTAHRAGGPYPNGMKPSAEHIKSLGLTPGIWLMPFAGTWNDPFFENRRDWFAKRDDGTPYDTNWGGTCFDMTHPEVQVYVRDTIKRITHDWGYKYLKLDGLWTGSATEQQYVNDAYKDDHIGNSKLADLKKANVEALRDGLRLVRDAAGKDVFILGCCAPQNMRSYGGAFGLVDAMRIGPDNGANVEGLLVGPRYGARNYFLHGRVWWNDPDPVYVRRSLSKAQSELSCTWAAVAGQITIASDELERLPADRLDILKRIMPPHGQQARPIDLFDRDLPRLWIVSATDRLPRHSLIGLFNWDQERLVIDESVERFGLDPKTEYAAFEFWSNRLLPNVNDRIQFTLEPIGTNQSVNQEKSKKVVHHCCAAIAVRPILDHPQVLSTSRHISQGLVDIVKEEWSENELAITSRVVAADPYGVRVLLKSKTPGWKLAEFRVSDEDKSKGVMISKGEETDDLVRLTIRSPESREVKWSARFARE
jgi:hypothetical protein